MGGLGAYLPKGVQEQSPWSPGAKPLVGGGVGGEGS